MAHENKTNEAKSSKRKKSLENGEAIKNLLIVHLLKSRTTSEEIDLATGLGAGNIRAKFGKIKLYSGISKKGKS